MFLFGEIPTIIIMLGGIIVIVSIYLLNKLDRNDDGNIEVCKPCNYDVNHISLGRQYLNNKLEPKYRK